VLVFIGCLVIRVCEKSAECTSHFGFSGAFEVSLLVLLLSIAMLITVFVALIALVHNKQRAARACRLALWKHNGFPICPRSLDATRWHLFLSHQWTSSQDQVRAIKERLREVVPTLKVFLDVDNHPSKSGVQHPKAKFPHEFVEFSDAVLVFLAGEFDGNGCHSSYFHSMPCRNELKWAIDYGKTIVWVLETNASHGGVPLEVHLRDAEEFCVGPYRPALHLFQDAVNNAAIIEWYREEPFQMVTLSSILKQVMSLESNGGDIQTTAAVDEFAMMGQTLNSNQSEIIISNTLVCLSTKVGPPARQLDYHLYCSRHDNNAEDVIDKMRMELKGGTSLRATNNFAEFDRANQMLVFLNSKTNLHDDDKLLAELRCGLRWCADNFRDPATYFVLVHETRRDMEDQKFGAIPFEEVIKRMPDDLKQRPMGVFASIAIPWCAEPHQQVSRQLLLRQLEGSPRESRRKARPEFGAVSG